MAIGIAGDSIITFQGLPAPDLDTIELRTISTLLAQSLGVPPGVEQVVNIRNDEAFALQIPTPLPGAGR